jgi:hypothetical protein
MMVPLYSLSLTVPLTVLLALVDQALQQLRSG